MLKGLGSVTTLWASVKAGVKGEEPAPASDSDGTEGPDSPVSEHAEPLTARAGDEQTATDTTQAVPDDVKEKTPSPPAESPKASTPAADGEVEGAVNQEEGEDLQFPQLEEVSNKAINTAKEWGSYLFSFGKAASQSVAKTAKQFKDTVEEKTILGDFNREQEKFMEENKDKKKVEEASVPPWVGYNEEESMKKQILALSQDKRNFLRNPPAGVQFSYDFAQQSPIAAVMLVEDPDLEKMRFELVPQKVTEEAFWRNYFYRVSLIKQSAQLTTLAQQTGDSSNRSLSGSPRTGSQDKSCTPPGSDGSRTPTKSDPVEMMKGKTGDSDDIPTSSPLDHEFASDAFQENQLSEEELRKEMQQLGVSGGKDNEDDIPEWERELQAELQEYEVVTDGNPLDDADLENEILQQIEAEANGQ